MRTPIRSLLATLGAATLVLAIAGGGVAEASTGPVAHASPETVTNGSETVDVASPFVLLQSSSGVPPVSNTICPDGGQFSNETDPSSCEGPGIPAASQGVITGSGFTPGDNIYVELCNGVPPTTSGYTTAANCTYSNTATIVPASGDLSINTAQGSYQFEIFHGEDLNDEDWNCLAPGDNPDGTTTAVGDLPIDSALPSYGASTVGTAGGSTAPCQLRIGDTLSYTSNDIFIPVTNLDGSETPPAVTPGAPGTPSVTAGPEGTGRAQVSFTAPTTGGTATSYTVNATDTTTSAVVTASGSTSPINVGGLTIGDSYTFTVTAMNTAGSATSAASGPVLIPGLAAPDAPGTPTVTLGPDGSGEATITAKASSSGGAASSYTITGTNTVTSAVVTAMSGSPSAELTGLTIGDTYTFTVTATNSTGSATSAASAPVEIPALPAPGAPSTPEVTVGPVNSGDASVSFTASTSGGAASSFVVTATPTTSGTAVTATATSSPISVTKLTPGLSYTFTVKAENASGSATSAPSAAVEIPFLAKPDAPAAPKVTVGTAGSGDATVTFTPSASGGKASSFVVKATPTRGGTAVTATGTASPISVAKLTPGVSYTFTVEAENSAGTATSAASAAVTIPAAVAPGISGTAPAVTAGKVYRYQFKITGDPTPKVTSSGLPRGLTCSATGLISGKVTKSGSYTVKLTATNSAKTVTKTFTLTVHPGAAAKVTVKQGSGQTAREKAGFRDKLEVTVTDAYGNKVSGAKVTFKVTSGPADFPRSAKSATATTTSAGVATAPALTATSSTGTVRVTATVSGVRTAASFSEKVVKS
jgi:hypothetical protein